MQATSIRSSAAGSRRPPIQGLRWWIAVTLCLSTALNYLDRQTLSILAATIQRELQLTDVDYSFVTSAFLVSYTAMYAVSGRLLDRFGTRTVFLLSVVGWSVANMLHAFASSARQLAAFRFLLGIGESANFPAGVKAAAEWFPMRERALAVGIFNSGSSVGAAIAAPLVSFVALSLGWRMAFVVTGALGLLWAVLWIWLYRAPADHPRLDSEERELILGGATGAPARVGAAVTVWALLGMRRTWGCVAARALIDPVTYFLTFWVPKYLQSEHGFSLAQLGTWSWIPFTALAAGTLFGGWLPHRLIGRGWSVDRARKTVMLACSLAIPAFYLVLCYAPGSNVALAAIAGLMFGHGAWGNITIPAEVFPKSVVGTVSGLGGTVGGIVGILSQLAIGHAVQNGSYVPVFVVCALVYLVALALVQRLVGRLGEVRELP